MLDSKNESAKSPIELTQLEELLMTTLLRQELYGLQMVQAISAASQGQRCLSIGSLYPTLHRLEKKELIQSRWGDESREERGAARRRYYKLTQLGAIALDEVQQLRVALNACTPICGTKMLSTRTSQQIVAEIEEYFGFLPRLFTPAQQNPQVLENLWQQTLFAYIDNPLSTLFKEKLSAYLSGYYAIAYSTICHSCTLYSLGMKASEVLDLLQLPPPTQINIEPIWDLVTS